MGVRRLAALVDGLPPDAALRRDGSMWTLENELTAVTCELLQMWLAMQVGMWMPKGSKVPEVVPLTHPDRHKPPAAERKKATSDPAELARAFGR